MKYDIIVPALIAFGVSVILSPIIIPFLKKLKFGQFVRDDGPESHLKKSGTPTMGGFDHPVQYRDYIALLHQGS